MLDKIKNTIKHSTIYGLGNISTKILGFILLPIYFHYLTIEQYGILAIFEITTQILTEVLLISMPTCLIRWYSDEEDPIIKKSIVFTTFTFILFIAVIECLSFIPFSKNFSVFFFNTTDYSTEFTYIFLLVGSALLDRMVSSLIRVKQKPIFFSLLSFIKVLIILSLNIYFVVHLQLGIKGILLSSVSGQLIVLFISSIFVIKNSNLRIKFSILFEMLNYGFPLIFSTISSLVLSLGDRYIIKIFLGDAAVGIYNAGYKIASMINVFIIQPFQLGYLPIAFSQLNQKDANRFFSKVLTYLTLVLLLAFLFVGLLGGNIIRLITHNPDYLASVSLIPFLALSFVFKGIQYNFSLGFHFAKKTKYIAYLVLIVSLMNVGLNIWLIPIWGIISAVINVNFSMLVLIIMTYYIAQKKYYIKYEISKIIFPTLYVFLVFGVSILLGKIKLSFYLLILIKLFFIILLPLVLYLFNYFEEVELITIKKVIQKWKNPLNWKNNFKQIRKKEIY